MVGPDGAGFDYDFWVAIAMGVYAFASEYIGKHPEIKQNTVYQLIAAIIKGIKK